MGVRRLVRSSGLSVGGFVGVDSDAVRAVSGFFRRCLPRIFATLVCHAPGAARRIIRHAGSPAFAQIPQLLSARAQRHVCRIPHLRAIKKARRGMAGRSFERLQRAPQHGRHSFKWTYQSFIKANQRSLYERRAPPESPERALLKPPSLRGAPGLLNVRCPGLAGWLPLRRFSPGFQLPGLRAERGADAVFFGSKPSITSTGMICLVKRSMRLTLTPSA